MDWKDFLFPTKLKILISAVIFLFFVPFIEFGLWRECFKAQCPVVTSMGSVLTYLFYGPHWATIYNILYLNVGAGLVVCYIFSCLILRIRR